MKIPVETKPVLWGVVGGAIAMAIVGFTWGGWVTGGTAEAAASQRASSAVVVALAPICVEKFQHATDVPTNLAALKKNGFVVARRVRREGRLGDGRRDQSARTGNGSGQSLRAVACRVTCPVPGLDRNHPADGQLMKFARRHFAGDDGMRPNPDSDGLNV